MAQERVKPLGLTVEDENGKKETYTLEFNRDTINFAENRGFKVADCSSFPMTKIPEFFWYAFRMHHPRMSKANTDKIIFDKEIGWGGLSGIPDGVFERLLELWDAPYGDAVEAKNSKIVVEL